MFALFRFNYNNQYLSAFPDLDTLNMAKQVWARLLVDYEPETIMRAAERAVKESKYLPSVNNIIEFCEAIQSQGLPSARSAYIEACRAPSPKKQYQWSHPAVYYAGVASDWYFLANTPEQDAFPVFEHNYNLLLERVKSGEDLSLNIPAAIPEKIHSPLPKKEQAKRFNQLKKTLL